MESANLQQLQDLQLVGSSSSSSLDNTDPSCFGASTANPWSPSVSLNSVSFSQNYNNEMLNTRDNHNNSECVSLSHMHNHSLTHQDLALQWHHHHHHHQSSYDHHHHQDLLKIKQEHYSSFSSNQLPNETIPKFTDMVNTPAAAALTKYLKMNHHDPHKEDHHDLNDLTDKLLLKTISSGFEINRDYCSYPHSSSSSSSSSSPSPSPSSHGGSFSQIYPSINISSLSHSPLRMNIPRPFDMNLQALDGTLFSGLVNPNTQDVNLMSMHRGGFFPFGVADHHHHHQTIHHRPPFSPTTDIQMEHFANYPQASEGKRPNMLIARKGGENAPKKPRVEPRASCPPLKVRKEKLGDRIAALQQLVSPFGKTDTASVLMEAIGYIKFLQNQIETLSVPYMRSSRNRTGKISQGVGSEEPRRDLKSRGLCLVPLSCTSYVTGDGNGGGGGFWPLPPGYSGGT